MTERTEEEALAGFLQVAIGGSPVRLRALTIDESDAWLDRYATAMAGTDVLEGDSGEDQMRSLVKHASAAALELVVAYDIDDVLGGADALRRLATKREVAAALRQMVTVEDPLAEDAGRLADAAFGLPVQMAADRLEASEPMLRLVKSLSTRSGPGASTTPATSDQSGPASNSSSTGRTRRTATSRTPTSAAS